MQQGIRYLGATFVKRLPVAYFCAMAHRPASGQVSTVRVAPRLTMLAIVAAIGWSALPLAAGAPEVAWSASLGSDGVQAVAYSTDGQLLAAGDDGGRIRWFESKGGDVRGTLESDNNGVANLWFRTDGTLLSFDAAFRLRRWRLTDQMLLRSNTFPDRTALRSYSEAAGLVGGTVYSPTIYATSMVWRAESAIEVFNPRTFAGLGFSPDGQELAVGEAVGYFYYVVSTYRTSDWSLRETFRSDAWDPPGEHFPQQLLGPIRYSPDRSLLLPASWGVSSLHRLPEGTPYGLIGDFRYTDTYSQMLFTPDGQMVVVMTGQALRFWRVKEGAQYYPALEYDEGLAGQMGLAISPDGNGIAVGFADGRVTVFHMPVIITDTERRGEELILRWVGGSGPFQVQQRADLVTGDWLNAGDPTLDNSFTGSPSGVTGFLRVVRLGE